MNGVAGSSIQEVDQALKDDLVDVVDEEYGTLELHGWPLMTSIARPCGSGASLRSRPHGHPSATAVIVRASSPHAAPALRKPSPRSADRHHYPASSTPTPAPHPREAATAPTAIAASAALTHTAPR
ncbi:hypothetical protein GCM10009680_78310 [Streptomyces yatensis]|uniref:Uncharacterized protein n=1 Tax=Streptomyces yatensis TaxID=155177 RepID=A0ABN2JF95_9ACTN